MNALLSLCKSKKKILVNTENSMIETSSFQSGTPKYTYVSYIWNQSSILCMCIFLDSNIHLNSDMMVCKQLQSTYTYIHLYFHRIVAHTCLTICTIPQNKVTCTYVGIRTIATINTCRVADWYITISSVPLGCTLKSLVLDR